MALALGRTRRELLATVGSDELAELLAVEALFELPDGYLIAGELGALVSAALGGRGRRRDHAPYYRPSTAADVGGDLASFRAFLGFASTHARPSGAPRDSRSHPIPRQE